MRTGFVVLAHERLDHAAALARHLADAGAPVVVHVDARSPGAARAALDDLPGRARVISTRCAEWGMFGLVDATLDAVRTLEALAPDLRHVALLSGSCLPIRPVAELDRFLAARPASDFIESVPVADAPWVQGGLSEERFTLCHPFPWKRRRRLFDVFVEAQRAIGVRRRMPGGVEPRLGLQWWCLTAATLRRLLSDPRLPAWRRWFRRAWIPDESFFQSLVPVVSGGEVLSQPLTLQRWDAEGRPVVFHDDHLGLLEGSDYFFARKIDPDASGLYARFLSPGDAAPGEPRFEALVNETPFEEARFRARDEHRGVPSAARWLEGAGAATVETRRPYAVFVGETAALARLRAGLGDGAPIVLHGRIFGPGPAEFATPGDHYAGKLPAAPRLRDYRPAQFLARLIWADHDRPVAFLFAPGDNGIVAAQVLGDPNARLLMAEPCMLDAISRAAALPVPRRAWSRVADPGCAAAALAGDWTDPCGWTLPGEAP